MHLIYNLYITNIQFMYSYSVLVHLPWLVLVFLLVAVLHRDVHSEGLLHLQRVFWSELLLGIVVCAGWLVGNLKSLGFLT